MGSDPLDETDAAGNTNNASFNEYVFFGGKRIARRDSTNAVNYYFADHLGTARVIANSSGAILDDSDFYPFGGERIVTSSSGNHYKFTGKERDSESGLDNFIRRYDSSSLGRFMSPDPANIAGDLLEWESPQSWNAYSYVRNDPINATDPDGEDCVFTQGDKAYVARGDCSNLPDGAKNATYVAGTVNEKSGQYDPTTGTLSFSYTPYSSDAGGSGATIGRDFIAGVYPSGGVSDADRLNAVAQGMDLAAKDIRVSAEFMAQNAALEGAGRLA
jgi:RHS repeat-associated protein